MGERCHLIDLEFIKRAKELSKTQANENIKKTRDYQRKYMKKYYSTEYAKEKQRLRNFLRYESFKNLDKEELENTKNFYRNCPKNYVVDHILPISKGGNSRIENLQYLTLSQNSSKGDKDGFCRFFEI